MVFSRELTLIISLMDLTSLNESDDYSVMNELVTKSINPIAKVAAVCVYPKFVEYLKPKLDPEIALATVINFPRGTNSLLTVEKEIKDALKSGADELDLVIPYHDYIHQGESKNAIEMVQMAKDLCQERKLKVIIESGELSSELIAMISKDMIKAGADFLKTSTGKTPVGATLEAAKIMLKAIAQSGATVGFKASGGIRTLTEAQVYIDLAHLICGDGYINKKYFRFGVSGLLDNILEVQYQQTGQSKTIVGQAKK